jgi:hypothetical protein
MAYAFTLATTKYLERTTNLLDYNSNYTAACWIIFNQLTTFDTLFCFSDGTANNRDILILDTTVGTTLATRVNVGGAQTTQAGSTTLSTGVWYYVALVRDAQNSLKVYINGSLDSTNTRSTTGRAAISNMRVGVEQTTNNAINASMAHMLMASTNWSAAQLINQSRLIRPIWASSLYGWWPILIDTNRNKDLSGAGHDWTENGTIGDVANPGITWGGMPLWFSQDTSVPVTTTVSGGIRAYDALSHTISGNDKTVHTITPSDTATHQILVYDTDRA